MCYFLVEGFQYTHSKKNYAIRLAIFALVSEIPYCLAFTNNGLLEFRELNMLFTLLICFAILMAVEKVSNKVIRTVCISMLLFGGLNFAGGLGRFSMEINLIYALGSMMGIALAGIVIVIFYNGRRIEKGSVFFKWFFYWFYPVHLLLLGIIRVTYMGRS